MTAWYEQDGDGPLPDISVGRTHRGLRDERGLVHPRSGPAHGPSSGSRSGDRPAAPRVTVNGVPLFDDGIFAENRPWPYESMRDSGRLSAGAAVSIVMGVTVAVLALIWWLG